MTEEKILNKGLFFSRDSVKGIFKSSSNNCLDFFVKYKLLNPLTETTLKRATKGLAVKHDARPVWERREDLTPGELLLHGHSDPAGLGCCVKFRMTNVNYTYASQTHFVIIIIR